jgi:hypothetical protein
LIIIRRERLKLMLIPSVKMNRPAKKIRELENRTTESLGDELALPKMNLLTDPRRYKGKYSC